jgi:outer membrane beta-barrel protein
MQLIQALRIPPLAAALLLVAAAPALAEDEGEERALTEEEELPDFDAVRATDRPPREGTPLIAGKLHPMAGRFEIAGLFDYSLNDKYTKYLGGSGHLNYHIFDWLGLDLYGGYLLGDETSIADKVRIQGKSKINLDRGDTELCAVSETGLACEPELPDLWQTTWFAGANLQWAPLYGKLSVVSEYDLNFQFFLTGGVAVEGIQKKQNDGTFDTTTPIRISGNGGIGLRLMPLDFMALRVELRNYRGPNPPVPERASTGQDQCPEGYTLQVGARTECIGDWSDQTLLQAGISLIF